MAGAGRHAPKGQWSNLMDSSLNRTDFERERRIEAGSGAGGRTERNGRDETTRRARPMRARIPNPLGRASSTSVGTTPPLDSVMRMSCKSTTGCAAHCGSAGFCLPARVAVHRAHLPGVGARRAALVRFCLGPGPSQRLLAAQRRRNEDLHHHVAEDHGQTQRREVPSDGSHRLPEIIQQAFGIGSRRPASPASTDRLSPHDSIDSRLRPRPRVLLCLAGTISLVA